MSRTESDSNCQETKIARAPAWISLIFALAAFGAFACMLFSDQARNWQIAVGVVFYLFAATTVLICRSAILKLGANKTQASLNSVFPLILSLPPIVGPILTAILGIYPMLRGRLLSMTTWKRTGTGGRLLEPGVRKRHRGIGMAYDAFDIHGFGRPAGLVFVAIFLVQPLIGIRVLLNSNAGLELREKLGTKIPVSKWNGTSLLDRRGKKPRDYACERKRVTGHAVLEAGSLQLKECTLQSSPSFRGTAKLVTDRCSFTAGLSLEENSVATISCGDAAYLAFKDNTRATARGCRVAESVTVEDGSEVILVDCKVSKDVLVSKNAKLTLRNCVMRRLILDDSANVAVDACQMTGLSVDDRSVATLDACTVSEKARVYGQCKVAISNSNVKTLEPRSRKAVILTNCKVADPVLCRMDAYATFKDCELGPLRPIGGGKLDIEGGSIERIEIKRLNYLSVSRCRIGELVALKGDDLAFTSCEIQSICIKWFNTLKMDTCQVTGNMEIQGRNSRLKAELKDCSLAKDLVLEGTPQLTVSGGEFNGTLTTQRRAKVTFRGCKMGSQYKLVGNAEVSIQPARP